MKGPTGSASWRLVAILTSLFGVSPGGRVLLFFPLTLVSGCPASEHTTEPSPPSIVCDPPTCYPRRVADGTVDATAADAWPDRAGEPAPLTPEQLARWCAERIRCGLGAATSVAPSAMTSCIASLHDYERWEQLAGPIGGYHERWEFVVRDELARVGDCSYRYPIVEPEAPVFCFDVGCSVSAPLSAVRCDGEVAAFTQLGKTRQRDCARSYTRCDPASATACTDRHPVACLGPAVDRCDGAVRIGCSEHGSITFHDCARIGATCSATGCAYVANECVVGQALPCQGDDLAVCVRGKRVIVSAAQLGATCGP